MTNVCRLSNELIIKKKIAAKLTNSNTAKMVCCNGFIYPIGDQFGQNLDTTTQTVEQFNITEGR